MWWWSQCSTLNDKLIIAFTIQISFGFWIFGVLLLLFVFCCLDIHTQCIKDILHLDGVILTFRLAWQLFRFCFQFIYWFLCFDNSVQKKNTSQKSMRENCSCHKFRIKSISMLAIIQSIDVQYWVCNFVIYLFSYLFINVIDLQYCKNSTNDKWQRQLKYQRFTNTIHNFLKKKIVNIKN